MEVLSQRDPRWKTVYLGFSKTITLGSHGCLLVVMTMLAKLGGKNTDPIKLNEALKRIGGFDNETFYKWYYITKIYSDIAVKKIVDTPKPLSASQLKEIDLELSSGRPVVLQVDMVPNTESLDSHFVLLVDKKVSDYYIADPWDGLMRNITSVYGDIKTAVYRYILHEIPMADAKQTAEEVEKALYRDDNTGRSKFMEMWHKINHTDESFASREDVRNLKADLFTELHNLPAPAVIVPEQLTKDIEEIKRLLSSQPSASGEVSVSLLTKLRDFLNKLLKI